MAQGQNRNVPQPGHMQNFVAVSASSVSSQPNTANGTSRDGIRVRQDMLNRM